VAGCQGGGRHSDSGHSGRGHMPRVPMPAVAMPAVTGNRRHGDGSIQSTVFSPRRIRSDKILNRMSP